MPADRTFKSRVRICSDRLLLARRPSVKTQRGELHPDPLCIPPNAATRTVLAPLAHLAEVTSTAVVGVMHLKKSEEQEVGRGSTASRASIAVGGEPLGIEPRRTPRRRCTASPMGGPVLGSRGPTRPWRP